MRRGEGHFAPTIARGELNVQEFRNASFPYVVVSITRCDAGWYVGPDYDGLVPLDDA